MEISPDEILIDVLKESVNTNSIETKLILLENYDIHYGIFNHGMYEDRPYSLIEMHDTERFDTVNPLYELMEKYVEKNVLKFFGMSFDTFIEMPRDRVNKMFEICDTMTKRERQRVDPLLKELEDMNKIGK